MKLLYFKTLDILSDLRQLKYKLVSLAAVCTGFNLRYTNRCSASGRKSLQTVALPYLVGGQSDIWIKEQDRNVVSSQQSLLILFQVAWSLHFYVEYPCTLHLAPCIVVYYKTCAWAHYEYTSTVPSACSS
jgi:hypothetical protein